MLTYAAMLIDMQKQIVRLLAYNSNCAFGACLKDVTTTQASAVHAISPT